MFLINKKYAIRVLKFRAITYDKALKCDLMHKKTPLNNGIIYYTFSRGAFILE
jgi:hypothetical protein